MTEMHLSSLLTRTAVESCSAHSMLMLMATLVKICASSASLAYDAKQAKSSGMGSGQKELENRVQGKMTACLLKTNLVLVRSGHDLKGDSLVVQALDCFESMICQGLF